MKKKVGFHQKCGVDGLIDDKVLSICKAAAKGPIYATAELEIFNRLVSIYMNG